MSTDATTTLADAEARLAALGPRPFPLPLGGMTPIVAGAFAGASRRDWVVCGARERVGAVLRGCAVERLVDPAAGARPYKLLPTSGAPGNRALHAVGVALATGQPTLCILGLASAASGAFFESLNAARLTGATVTFLLVVQELTEDAPVGRQLAYEAVTLAAAFGMPVRRVEADAESVENAVRAARQTAGPTLIEVRWSRS